MFKIKKSHKMTKVITRYKIPPIALFLLFLGSFLFANFAFSTEITEKNIINLTNKERINNKLHALKENEILKKAAEKKAEAILENNTFAHTINNNSFSFWIKEAGYEYSFIGENLAIDFVSSEGTIKAWLNSQTHKENILNDRFEEIGVAVVPGKFENENTILVVQIFGTPLKSFNDLSTNNTKEPQKEKLLVKFENDKLVHSQMPKIIAQTKTDEKNNTSHLLLDNSKLSQFYSLLFAVIVSSLIVSLVFPNNFKINIKPKEQLTLKLFDNKQKL